MSEYDRIAEKYRDSKLLPFRDYIESYTLFKLAGNLAGKSVLDLACGEGHYTRRLMQAGAKAVLGVDISSRMIELAQEAESREPLGCRYQTGDAADLELDRQFDLITGVYLLNYAASVEQLTRLCRSAFRHLKPGGRFIGFNDNIANDPANYPKYEKYGFIKTTSQNRIEGAPITYLLINPDGTRFQFDNFYLHNRTYQKAFEDAGFLAFNWEGPWLSPAGEKAYPPGYWSELLDDPPLIGFAAQKAIE